MADERPQWIDFVPVWSDTSTSEVTIELVEPVDREAPDRPGRWTRLVGWMAVVAGIMGIRLGIALMWLGLVMIDRAAGTLHDGLEIADESLTVVLETLDVAGEVVDVSSDSLLGMQVSLGSVTGSIRRVERLLGETSDILSTDIAESFDALLAALPGLIAVGDTLDRTLRGLAFLGVPYDPDEPIGDGFREMEAALIDVPERLRDQGALLGEMRSDLASTAESLARLQRDVAEIRVVLDETAVLLDQYRAAVIDGVGLVAGIRRQIDAGAPVARLVVIVVGLLLILYQGLPIHLGYKAARSVGPGS